MVPQRFLQLIGADPVNRAYGVGANRVCATETREQSQTRWVAPSLSTFSALPSNEVTRETCQGRRIGRIGSGAITINRMTSSSHSRQLPDEAPDVLDEMRLAVQVSAETRSAFERACTGDLSAYPGQLGVDVWAFDPTGTHILLVDHPFRGWVAPGGKLAIGEHPRLAAARELREETGVVVDQGRLRPAAAHGNGSTSAYSLSYAATVPMDVTLTPEPMMNGVKWWRLTAQWPSIYEHDRARISQFASSLQVGDVTL